MKSFVLIIVSLFTAFSAAAGTVYDESRDRHIPIEISHPTSQRDCSEAEKCPVAFLSAGYGVSHVKYSFLSQQLNQLGYMVVAIGHELESDPPLSVSGDLYESRSENWSRGAETLDFIKHNLEPVHQNYNFSELLLIGHSNGGDISSWLANQGTDYIATVITLDHRRVPLPRSTDIDVLSIRGSDYPADDGVLPSSQESERYGICVKTIAESRHNDMTDYGPVWLKDEIAHTVANYLTGGRCS
ncbi:alpha/beta hydrolase [Aliidiomarina sedimenti]|uniref:Alpha/beta hydrolase n=1 Tax=Aliidiomarina sedimenti TaxID=1933879 RepID=A0ABY0BXK2_9GAMM|nr:alpha/beta hydrolase [Aliidiomarina sedimenti]RUO29174.1 alpha/beta hydrolase [Aliidiomarina sedimenti]